MTTTPFPRRTDEARTGMQSSRRRVSGTLSLPCSTRWCAVLTRPASALLWRISSLRLAQKATPSSSRTFLSSLFRRAGAEGVRASATSCITCSWCSMSAMQRVGGPCGAHSNVRIVERPAQPSPRVQSWQRGLCPFVSQGVEHVCTPVEGRQGGARCSNVPRALRCFGST